MKLLFVWDKEKAEGNKDKHKVTFDEASSVFKHDSNMINVYDSEHSHEEDRWITIGLSSSAKILTISHTHKYLNDNAVEIRIISSRKATKQEIEQYKEQL